MITEKDISFLQQAVDLAKESVIQDKGGPFGCLIVRDGKIIGKGNNRVTSNNDPTAHAEIIAIRDACTQLGTYQLQDCVIYTSCEPCPMCLGAIYWARPARVYYAATRLEAAEAGFDDAFIYNELRVPIQGRKIPFEHYHADKFLTPFRIWTDKVDKKEY